MHILTCKDFDDESTARFSNKCCDGDCHPNGALINVTPYAEDADLMNRRLDWSLGIQARVCCGRYEFVRSFSREWWINRLRKFGVEVPTNRPKIQVTSNRSQGPSKVKTKIKCPDCGSEWNEVICDGCGYSG